MANSDEQSGTGTSTSGNPSMGTTPGGSGSAERSSQDNIRQKGRESADEVRQAAQRKAEGVFDQQKGAAADQAHGLSSAFRKMAEELDSQDQGYLSGYVTRMASCTDTVSQRLRDQDMNGLMRQVRDYSRQQPALFMGGAVAAGFVLARFLNSSQKHDATPATQDQTSSMSSGVSPASGSVSSPSDARVDE